MTKRQFMGVKIFIRGNGITGSDYREHELL